MSRRTDVLNKYPAPRVSAVNQAVPGCSQGSYVFYYTTTIYCFYNTSSSSSSPSPTSTSFGRSCYDVVRTGSSGINQPGRDKRVRGGGKFYDRPRRSFGIPSTGRAVRLREGGGRNYNARARVNYDPKTLNRYWLRRTFFSPAHPFCAQSNHLSYIIIYVLTSPAVSVISSCQFSEECILIDMRMRGCRSTSRVLGNKMSQFIRSDVCVRFETPETILDNIR